MFSFSVLTFSDKTLLVVDVLRNQFVVLLGGVVLLGLIKTGPARAEEKIQAVVNSSGRIVFTNLAGNAPKPRVDDVPPVIDNTPRPPGPVIAPSTDLLAEAMPEALRKLVESISLSHAVDPALVRAGIKTDTNFNRGV